MVSREITITNPHGLHARPAARLASLAAEFESSVRLAYKDQVVNAKSILGLMILAAPSGARVQLIVDGPDEKAALEQLAGLLAEATPLGPSPCH